MRFVNVVLDKSGTGVFSLLRHESTYYFEWAPAADSSTDALPLRVSFEQISEIVVREFPPAEVGIRILLAYNTPFPRLLFAHYAAIQIDHMINFLMFKRVVNPPKPSTMRYSVCHGTPGRDADVFTFKLPSAQTPNVSAKLAAHNSLLSRLNFQPHLPGSGLLSRREWDQTVLRLSVGRGPDAVFHTLKHTIHLRGLAPDLRPFVWAKLLKSVPYSDEESEIEKYLEARLTRYRKLHHIASSFTDYQSKTAQQILDMRKVIIADVKRNDRHLPEFRDDLSPNLLVIEHVMIAYAIHNRDAGYVQGMTDLGSPFVLMYIKDWPDPDHAVMYNSKVFTREEVESFIFSSFVEFLTLTQHDRMFTDLAPQQKFVLDRSVKIASAIHPDIKELMGLEELESLTFLFRPVLLLFKREFSPDDVLRLWDSMMTAEQPYCFVRYVAAAICILVYPKLIQLPDSSLGQVMIALDESMRAYTVNAVLQLITSLMETLDDTIDPKLLKKLLKELPVDENHLDYRSKYFPLHPVPKLTVISCLFRLKERTFIEYVFDNLRPGSPSPRRS
jgi:hypothetical protein